MSEFFLKIVNMSISASWIVLAVLLLRLLFRKAPKWITVLLWGIVAIRLICPFSIESVMSLIPSAETISPQVLIETPEINTGIPALNNTLNPIIQDSTVTVAPEKSINTLKLFVLIFSKVWIAGVALILVYTIISYWRVRRKIGTAVLLRDNIYQSETVVSPFVLGIIRPRIYLPFGICEQDMEHVIAHEQAHIRRKDHWWKPLGFLLLTLHWFNPLMWLGYVLLCRDIELACDEKVVKEMNTEQRADYSQALLTCSVNRRMIAACPLAFGEVGVKDRVKSVLNYKKPAFWIIIVAIIASAVAAVCFITNPKTTLGDELSIFLDGQICEHHYSAGHTDNHFTAVNHKVLGINKSWNKTTVYLWVLYNEYSYANSEIKLEAGAHTPTVITVKRTGEHGHYKLVEYWEPRDGSYYADDIREKFPWYLHGKALDSQRYIEEQSEFCENAAKEYYSSVSSIGGVNDSTNVIASADIEQLEAKFPMYFDLDTSKGLAVYIWQMAADSYSCGLLSGKNRNYTQEEIWNLHTSSATLDEMRAIIAYYISNGLIAKDEITINAIQMPYSSYAYTIDDAYRQKLNELFWSESPIVESSQYSPIIDTATFDIDGDGNDEQCLLRYGPTSGLFTFIFSASENGELEYFNIFNSPSMELSFEKNADGQTVLAGKDSDYIRYMELTVHNGNIVISSDEQDISYWGEQGVNSPFAPKTQKSQLDAAIASVLQEQYRSKEPDGFIHVQSYRLLANETASGTPVAGTTNYFEKETVYLIVYHMTYRVNEKPEEFEGGFVPTVITFSIDEDGEYSLKDYWTPRAGTNYESDIRAKFPREVADDALDIEKYAEALKNNNLKQVTEYLNNLKGNP